MYDFITSLNQVNIVVLSEGAAFPLPLTLFVHVNIFSHARIHPLPFPGRLIFCFPYF